MRITELKPHHKYQVIERSYLGDGVKAGFIWSYHTTEEAAEEMCDEMCFRCCGESTYYWEPIDWKYEKEMTGCKSKKEVCEYYAPKETSSSA